MKCHFKMYGDGVWPTKATGTRWIDQKIFAMERVVNKDGLYCQHLQHAITDTKKLKDRAMLQRKFNKLLIYTNKLFYYIDLLPFDNLLELLVIDHNSSERRNIFVRQWLKLCTTPYLRWIMWSSLALCQALERVSGYLWYRSKWSCRFGHVLQSASGLEVLACSIDTDFNCVITMLQSCVPPLALGCCNLWQENWISKLVSSDNLKDNKVIFSPEFKIFLSQSSGILERNNSRSPCPPFLSSLLQLCWRLLVR